MSSNVRHNVPVAGGQSSPMGQVLYVGSAKHVKRMAKRLKKFAGVSHQRALEAMARAVGFAHWHECHTALDDPMFKGCFPSDLPAEIRDAMIGWAAVRLAEYLSQHVPLPVCSEDVPLPVCSEDAAREFLEMEWMFGASSTTEAPLNPDSQLEREPRSTGHIARSSHPTDTAAGGVPAIAVRYRRRRSYGLPAEEHEAKCSEDV